MASASEDPSSSDSDSDSPDDPEHMADDDDHDPEPMADDHDPEPAAEAAPADDHAPPGEVDVEKVVHLLRRANARGKGVAAMDFFSQRVGQPLPCLDGKVLTAEALNSATDILCQMAD